MGKHPLPTLHMVVTVVGTLSHKSNSGPQVVVVCACTARAVAVTIPAVDSHAGSPLRCAKATAMAAESSLVVAMSNRVVVAAEVVGFTERVSVADGLADIVKVCVGLSDAVAVVGAG